MLKLDKKALAQNLGLIFIGVLIMSVVWVYATPTTEFYIAGGIYPTPYDYTIFLEDSTYYSKEAHGRIPFDGSNITTVLQATNDALTSGGTILLKDIELPDGIVISQGVQIIESFNQHQKIYSSGFKNSSTIYPRGKIAEEKTQYTWTNLDAEQGVCTNGSYLWVTATERLSMWTMEGTRLYDVDAFNGDGSLTHVGDPDYWGGYVWVDCSNFAWGGDYYTVSLKYVYKFDADDLSYVTRYNVSTFESDKVFASVSYWNTTFSDYQGNSYEGFYALTFEENSTWLYQFNTTWDYQNLKIQLTDMCKAQGLTFLGGTDTFYVTGVTATDYTFEGSFAKTLTEYRGCVRHRSQTIKPYEGIDIDPHGRYLWVAGHHSAGYDPLWQMYLYP